MTRFFLTLVLLIIVNFNIEGFCKNNPISYQLALPGYRYQFPKDHAAHPEYKTEWWYYTGHLQTPDKRPYGFELTFFRFANDVDNPEWQNSNWSMKTLHMAHFTLSDIQKKQFYPHQKLNRSGLQTAGALTQQYKVWNENWQVSGNGKQFKLYAKTKTHTLNLTLTPSKPLVLHGQDGVDQKAACYGCASHYYSYTRLKATGFLIDHGKRTPVHGDVWMDHEFGSNQLTPNQVGWDWFSLQLNNGQELMLYQMRQKNTTRPDPFSNGTWVDRHGKAETLAHHRYQITPISYWKSPNTKARYPMEWHITLPDKQLNLWVQATFPNQEVYFGEGEVSPVYWEGSVQVKGRQGKQPIQGQGYVELTGYNKIFKAKI